MEYIAIAKNIKISPRKVRLVADGVKKKNVNAALSSLTVLSLRAAVPIRKALNSAMANATNNFQAKKEDLVISDIIIGEGTSMKRFHFAGRGRSRPYKRRTSHIRVILSDGRDLATNKTPVSQEQLKGGSAEPRRIGTQKNAEK